MKLKRISSVVAYHQHNLKINSPQSYFKQLHTDLELYMFKSLQSGLNTIELKTERDLCESLQETLLSITKFLSVI